MNNRINLYKLKYLLCRKVNIWFIGPPEHLNQQRLIVDTNVLDVVMRQKTIKGHA